MTEVITRNRMAVEANSRIRDRCNSGISWGSNNYPANSLAGWFGGTTAGRSDTLSAGHFQAGEPDASQAVDRLRSFANGFAAIRRTRIVIYRTHYKAGNQVIYDGTAVAHTAYSVGAYANGVPVSALRAGVEMDINTLRTSIDELYNQYVASARNTTLTLTNTICHSSCHSNCHCARGRR